MEKYGVEEHPEKVAEERKDTCPNCGAKLENVDKTGVLKCPACGTKPFEK